MYRRYYEMALFALTVILSGVMAITGLRLSRAALVPPVVLQAENTVNSNMHFIGDAEDTINKEEHSLFELFSILRAEEHLVDKILNYEI